MMIKEKVSVTFKFTLRAYDLVSLIKPVSD